MLKQELLPLDSKIDLKIRHLSSTINDIHKKIAKMDNLHFTVVPFFFIYSIGQQASYGTYLKAYCLVFDFPQAFNKLSHSVTKN